MSGRHVLRWEHNHPFWHHAQEHEMGCGPACLRCLAQWVTGKPSSEEEWRRPPWFDPASGMSTDQMRAAVDEVSRRAAPFGRLESDHVSLTTHDDVPPPPVNEGTLHLARIDSFETDGRNPYHWLIIVDVFTVRGKKGDDARVAVCIDPAADSPYTWRWDSLVNARLRDLVRVTWRSNSGEPSGGPA